MSVNDDIRRRLAGRPAAATPDWLLAGELSRFGAVEGWRPPAYGVELLAAPWPGQAASVDVRALAVPAARRRHPGVVNMAVTPYIAANAEALLARGSTFARVVVCEAFARAAELEDGRRLLVCEPADVLTVTSEALSPVTFALHASDLKLTEAAPARLLSGRQRLTA